MFQRMKGQQMSRGFTIVEVMTASALSILLVALASKLLLQMFQMHSDARAQQQMNNFLNQANEVLRGVDLGQTKTLLHDANYGRTHGCGSLYFGDNDPQILPMGQGFNSTIASLDVFSLSHRDAEIEAADIPFAANRIQKGRWGDLFIQELDLIQVSPTVFSGSKYVAIVELRIVASQSQSSKNIAENFESLRFTIQADQDRKIVSCNKPVSAATQCESVGLATKENSARELGSRYQCI